MSDNNFDSSDIQKCKPPAYQFVFSFTHTYKVYRGDLLIILSGPTARRKLLMDTFTGYFAVYTH
jgi:hypothetical protein